MSVSDRKHCAFVRDYGLGSLTIYKEAKLAVSRSNMRQKLLPLRVLAALIAVAGMLLIADQAPPAQAAGCESGWICAWSGSNYTGTLTGYGCPSAGDPNWYALLQAFSAKNRCSQSYEFGWFENGTVTWKFCMNPGGERPNPGRFNRVRWHWGVC